MTASERSGRGAVAGSLSGPRRPIRAGIVFGFAGQVDGLVRRIVAELEEAHGGPTAVLATAFALGSI